MLPADKIDFPAVVEPVRRQFLETILWATGNEDSWAASCSGLHWSDLDFGIVKNHTNCVNKLFFFVSLIEYFQIEGHTCAVNLLSTLHHDLPLLWGGWIISAKEKSSLTQSGKSVNNLREIE